MEKHRSNQLLLLLSLYGMVFLWSAINPKDYSTWFLEVAPALIGLGVLVITYKSYPLTPLAYVLITLHCCILFVGGHYTYAEVPFFDWVRDTLAQSRNNYDKIGHFAQGLVPAIIARELFIRGKIVAKKSWIPYFVITTSLAISAAYELLEWAVAAFTGESADAFLGTQGYRWDTQSDMLYASMGAVCALLLFSRLHDRQLRLVQALIKLRKKKPLMTIA
jgi:putative membrane protein